MLPHIQRREHQERALQVAKEVLSRGKIPCLTIPTGGGKTLVGVDIAERAINFDPKAKVLIISNLSPLMSQWDESILKFLGYGLYAYTDYFWGKKQRSKTLLNSKKIIIAMAQTIESRQWIPDEVSVVIWDEAHLSWFRHKCRDVVKKLAPNANHILLTATPYRLDGQEFGSDVEIKQIIPLKTLMERGFLTPFQARRIGNFSISSKTSDKEDYTTAEIEQIIEKCSPAKVYEEWVKHGYDTMPTIGVAPSKAQCKKYCDYFISQGALGVVVSDETSEGSDAKAEEEVNNFHLNGILPKTRKGACALFRQGKIMLWSVRVLTIGFDEPCAQVMLFLSATKSPAQLTQSIGRILRKHEGKDMAYVLDFTPSMVSLGRPDEIEDWNDVDKITGKKCPECSYICAKAQDECPGCGHKFMKAAPKPKKDNKICPECGTKCDLEDKECVGCGYEFPQFNLTGTENHNTVVDAREMEDIPFLDRNAEPKAYYQALLRRLYASGTNPDKAWHEFRNVKKFDPHRSWTTHAVFGSEPTFDNAAHYLAYLRQIKIYTSKPESWVWTKMQNEFGQCLTPIWKEHLTKTLKINLVAS